MRGPAAAALIAAAVVLIAAEPAAAAAPVNTVSPTITGKPRVGQTLSSSQGEWQGSPTSFFYGWLRCDRNGASCTAIGGATDPTYVLTPDDVDHRIRVEVTAQNADGASPAARSAATKVIRIPVPVSTAKPQISGTAREGQILTATSGTWDGSPDSFAFQWKRCLNGQCTAIPGATASTYLLGSADVGTRIRVRVTATNDGGNASAQSNSTGLVHSSTAGFKLGPPKHDTKRGLVRFRVTVPSAGVLQLKRTGKVRPDERHPSGPKTVKLTVKPRQGARHQLRKRGKVRVRVKVGFIPDAGSPIKRQRHVTLRSK